MFVENYRLENAESIMAGGDAKPIPYARISAEDWRVWTTFLPVRSLTIDKSAARNLSERSLYLTQGIPASVTTEIRKATEHFDDIEVWRKRQVDKDPIAVGVLGGERYMIARWGMEELIPFERIKKRIPLVLAWKYATHPLGAMAALVGLVYLAFTFLS
jgi:hypothetical protein